MGHESQIEPWLAPDHRSALLVSQGRLRRESSHENCWEGTPCAEARSVPSSWSGRQNQSCSTTWAGRQENIRPSGEGFLLTSPLIELFRHYGMASGLSSPRRNESEIRRHRIRSCQTSEVASLRVEDHVVISTADKDSLEEHGRQQAVFMTAWEALQDVHWRHE